MRAVVMAGGQGTRMRPYTTVLPKPLLPVGERPILAILLEQLAAAGVTRVDLCLGHLGELIRAYLADAPLPLGGLRLVLHTEPEPMGTAGALRDLPGLDEPFLVLNGDVLTAIDPGAVMAAHRSSGADLTVTTQVRETTIGAGVLELDGDAVTGYEEKPVLHHVVSLGVYCLAPSALDLLPAGRVDIPALAAALIAAGRPVTQYRYDGPWFDVGTREDHERATAELAAHPERYLPAARGTPTPAPSDLLQS